MCKVKVFFCCIVCPRSGRWSPETCGSRAFQNVVSTSTDPDETVGDLSETAGAEGEAAGEITEQRKQEELKELEKELEEVRIFRRWCDAHLSTT